MLNTDMILIYDPRTGNYGFGDEVEKIKSKLAQQ